MTKQTAAFAAGLVRDLRPGHVLWFDGQRQKVLALGASMVLLQSLASGARLSMSVADLVSAEDFTMDEEGRRTDTAAECTGDPLMDAVPEEALAEAKKRLRHLLEAKTGYQSGSALQALPGEPRSQYDPSITKLTDRIEAKASELACSPRALWSHLAQFDKRGLLGLVDQRATSPRAGGVEACVIKAMEVEVNKLTQESNITEKLLIGRIQARIRHTKPLPIGFVMKSDSTIRRILHERFNMSVVMGGAKSRRNADNRPKKAYTRFHATHAGEVVLIDSTPLDVFALDPVTHEWCSIQLTIAIDLYTRSIVGWRFARETKAVDAALLLADIIRPKRTREFWGKASSKPFVGIPQAIVAHIDAEDDPALAGNLIPIPFLHPESVLIDQGKVFLSDTFMAACRSLGIDLLVARPYTPTDKAHVERMFRTIRESFLVGILGYKGPDVHSRGKDAQENAFHYIHEIDEAFREWVATYWQERTHDGLFLNQVPTLEVTPNLMLAESVARTGFMYVPVDANLYYELLPVVWRRIQHYGVDNAGLKYDSEDLDPFRGQPSGYTVAKGKWPFRQDPRDKSVLHFWDMDLKLWRTIPWTGAGGQHRPFDDKTLTYAKQLTIAREGKQPTNEAVEETLRQLLDRMWNVSATDKRERRRLAEALHNTALAQRDREGGSGVPVAAGPVSGAGAETEVDANEVEDGDTLLNVRGADVLYRLVNGIDEPAPAVAGMPPSALAIKPVSEVDEDDDEALSY